jgi:DNA-binding NarL/FixJ family response regulator
LKTVDILIADDHALVRDGLRALVDSQPRWRVVGEAGTGREAVEMAQKLRPHVVILDFSMPELNGLDATRQILGLLPETEVLVLTMHDSEKLAEHCLAGGARGFILKSDARNQLVAAVTALVQHRPYFTPKLSALLRQESKPAPQKGPEAPLSDVRLTRREREILHGIAEGRTSKAIAAQLHLSDKTVEAHRSNLMKKLDLHSVAAVVRYAIRKQLIGP